MTPSVTPPVARGLPEPGDGLRQGVVMGVLNVTPDSFSDGGRFLDAEAAVTRGLAQAADGADIVDVGGESTRPGAERVTVTQELDRVVPVVESLSAAGICVSIDTMRAVVAERAVAAGAALVNDVSGGLADPAMLPWLADAGVPVVLMHWRGQSADMMSRATYPRGVVTEVREELSARLDAALAAGIDPARTVLDPGLGFAKEAGHNWELLAALPELMALGRPILVGASRKRFLGELLAEPASAAPRPVGERDVATAAVSALAVAAGVWGVRVHEVGPTVDAVRVGTAWRGASAAAGGRP